MILDMSNLVNKTSRNSLVIGKSKNFYISITYTNPYFDIRSVHCFIIDGATISENIFVFSNTIACTHATVVCHTADGRFIYP